MSKRTLSTAAVILSLTLFGLAAWTQGEALDQPKGDKDDPPKPVLGDREDVVFQNQRYLKVKNDTPNTLTVFYQYRTLVKGAFAWLPEPPKDGAEAISFELKAGDEVQLKAGDDYLLASRVRLWAVSEKEKFLLFQARDLWLVPEKNDEGDHVYPAEAPETFSFTFIPKKGDGDDPDAASASTFPGQDPNTLPPVIIPSPGDPLPGGGVMPVIHDLSVLPVFVSGPNATVRVKNKGHASENIGQKLFVKRVAPAGPAVDMGPIGPLLHHSVRVFPVGSLAPGDYVAFISPGDDAPFDGNDSRNFTVGAAAFVDLRVLPVTVAAGKATIKVKNVGSANFGGGRKLKVVKLMPGALPTNVGDINALAVNAVQTFADVALAAGTYKAFISPGDAAAHSANDSFTFIVGAASFVDLKMLPVAVIAGNNVHVKVKNAGTAPAPAGRSLMVVKLGGGAPMNKGPIGALAPGAIKTFASFTLPAGNYKAFINPGDAAPHAGNDFDNFSVGAAPFVDLKVLDVGVVGNKVHVKVKNVGTLASAAGRKLKVVKAGGATMDKGDIGALAAGATKTFAEFTLAAGNYKAFVDPGDPAPHAGNDFDNFTVAAASVPDLGVGIPTKAAGKVKATITNHGPGNYTAGTRQWHIEKLAGAAWNNIASGNIPNLANGASTTVQGNFAGAGTYRIRITGSDGNSGNNVKSKAL